MEYEDQFIPEHQEAKVSEAIEQKLEDCTTTVEFQAYLLDEIYDEFHRSKETFESAESFKAKAAELFKSAEQKYRSSMTDKLCNDGDFVREATGGKHE